MAVATEHHLNGMANACIADDPWHIDLNCLDLHVKPNLFLGAGGIDPHPSWRFSISLE